MDCYEVMLSPKKSALEDQHSPRQPNPQPHPQTTPPHSQDHYMVLIPSDVKPPREYAIHKSQSGDQLIQPGNERNGTNRDQSANTEVMELLSKQFTPDQLDLLLDMLKKMRVKGENPESSLKTRDLGYLVHKTADTLTDNL